MGELRRYALPLEDNYDWRRHLIPASDNEYDYWILPAGVRLYHGTQATFPDNQLPTGPTFYSSLDVAGAYAFASPLRQGEQGKVITVETIQPIRILDITSKTVEHLMKSHYFSAEEIKKLRQLFIHRGISKIRRQSLVELDREVSALICSAGFSGFGYPYVAGFHPEIMLCPGQPIRRIDLEYREIQQDSRCLFGINASGIINILPANLYDRVVTSGNKPYIYPYNERQTDKYLPYIRQYGRELCQPIASTFQNDLHEIERAIDERDLTKIKQYIDKGIVNGDIFRYALKTEDTDIIRMFLDAGMDVRYITASQSYPNIMLAISYGADAKAFIPAISRYPKLIATLIERGVDEKYLFSQSQDNVRLLYDILEAGGNPNAGLIPVEKKMPTTPEYFDILLSAGANDLDYIADQIRAGKNPVFMRQYLDRIIPQYSNRINPRSLMRLRDAIGSLDPNVVMRSGLSQIQRYIGDTLAR